MDNVEKIKVGVLGCTGLVGQQFIKLLANHPFFEPVLLAASPESSGKPYGEAVAWQFPEGIPAEVAGLEVIPCLKEELIRKDISLYFSALPSNVGSQVEDCLRKNGKFVFSNASSFRLDDLVPIVIPEVNPEHLTSVVCQKKEYGGFIVTNPNCVVSGLALALKPLLDWQIRSVALTTFQAISGAGVKGVPSLILVNNILPYIKDEEEKIERETRKILGQWLNKQFIPAELNFLINCARVPVRNGHLMSVAVELSQSFEVEEVVEKFRTFLGIPQEMGLPTAPQQPIIVRLEQDRPQPRFDEDAGSGSLAAGMAVTIGRVRKKGQYLLFFLLVNNLIRGAAGASILNAELAFSLKLISPYLDEYSLKIKELFP